VSDPEPQATSAAGRSVHWPRIAVTTVFVVHGLLFASWTAHIPDVKAHLGLTDGTLGFALLGAPVGSVIAMIAASWLLPRVGSRRIVQVALVGYCAAGPLVGLTGSLPALFAALFIWGAFQGTLDVAMNTQAIAVERKEPRVLMPGLHGSWSIGAFAGAGLGALAVAAGLTLSVQLLVLGTIALLAAGLLTARMLPAAAEQPGSRDASAEGRGHARPDRLLPALAVVATAGFVCGPPVIGRLSEWASLPVALGLLPLLTAFVVAGTLTPSVLRTEHQPRARAQCATAR
jgi:MFS family permease